MVFVAVGAFQFALDAGLFVVATWAGMPPAPANILSRLLAACVGFFLNGRMTFGRRTLDRWQFARYIATWVLLTGASTLAVAGAATLAGLRWAWLTKIAVEIALAFASYLLMRNWVFGSKH